MPGISEENMLSASSNSPTATIVLPRGNMTLSVMCADSYGASASSQTMAEATAYAPAPMSDMTTDAAELLGLATTNSDGAKATQLVSAFAGALGDESANGTISDDKLNAARRTRSVLASSLKDGASGAADAPSGQLVMMSQAALAVTSDPSQISSDALESSVGALESLGSAKAMEGAVTPPRGATCESNNVCKIVGGEERCRRNVTCVNWMGESVDPVTEPVDPALIAGVVNVISSVHTINLGSVNTSDEGEAAKAAANARSLRNLARKSQSAMTSGTFSGEFMKTISTPSLDLATQVNSPEEMSKGAVAVAPNIKVNSPKGAFGGQGVVAMNAVAWAAGASPFPTASPTLTGNSTEEGDHPMRRRMQQTNGTVDPCDWLDIDSETKVKLYGTLCPDIEEADWHSTIDFDLHLEKNNQSSKACDAHVYTEGGSCFDYCVREGRICLHAQASIDESCTLDPDHTRQDVTDNGCQQEWHSQICGCSAPKDPATTNSSVIGTRVLSLEFTSTGGEELVMKDLDEPFVLELALDEGMFACEAVSMTMEMCDGSCVPRGGCSDRAHNFCSFFDEDADSWVVDAKARPGKLSADRRRVICEFDHLTDVASFGGPTPGEQFNPPCFSCLSDFLANPFGMAVVIAGFVLLCVTSIGAFCRYYKYSQESPDHIAVSKFAEHRKKVLARDSEHKTSVLHDVEHRLRFDWDVGGIFCPIKGDPFDRCQRAMLFVVTMLVTLMVSLMFFQPEGEAACTMDCDQAEDGQETVCVEVCEESPDGGPMVAVVTAVISMPLVMGTTKALTWLRRPILQAVEPKDDTTKPVSVATMLKTRRAAAKAAKVAQLHGIKKENVQFENKSPFAPGQKSGTKVLQIGMGAGAKTAAVATDFMDDEELTELFNEIDTDGEGSLDWDEVKALLVKLGMPVDKAAVKKVMAEMDPDGDEDVTLVEFLTWWRSVGAEVKNKMAMLADAGADFLNDEELTELFNEIDTDGEGSLDWDEVKELMAKLGMPIDDKAVKKMMKEMDPDGDGEATLAEFLKWWRSVSVEMKQRITVLADASIGEEARQRRENRREKDRQRRAKRRAIAGAVERLNPGVAQSLAKLEFQNKLQVHLAAAKRMNASQNAVTLTNSRKLFDEIDGNGSGTMDRIEFERLMDRLHLKHRAGQFATMDTGRSGSISYEEFEMWAQKNPGVLTSTKHTTVNHLQPPKGGWNEYMSSESDDSNSDADTVPDIESPNKPARHHHRQHTRRTLAGDSDSDNIEELFLPSPPLKKGNEDEMCSPVRSKEAFAMVNNSAFNHDLSAIVVEKRMTKKKKMRGKQKEREAQANLDLYVAQAIAHGNALEGLQSNDPRPRKAKASCLPIVVALVCGLGCLFMIYGIAAKLGPAHTKMWMYAAGTSLLMKALINDMLKITVLAVFLKCADNINTESSELLTAITERIRQAAELAAEGGEDAADFM